jgi:DNA-binding transcriptional ArsR family regulator
VKDVDAVFKALADPSRRELLDRLFSRNGQTLNELCKGLGMARQSVSQHLDVLEAANLISVERQGREKLHFVNPVPIHEIYERWIRKYEQQRLTALHNFKTKLEGK